MAGDDFTQAITIGGEISALPHNDAWDNLEDWLNPRLGGGNAGDLIVCDVDGNPRPLALSGDATVDEDGAVSVTDNALFRFIASASARHTGTFLGSGAAGPYAFKDIIGHTAVSPQPVVVPFYYDPAWFALSGRTSELLMSVIVCCHENPSAPASTSTVGLYAFDTPAGAVQQADLVAGAEVDIASVANNTITTGTVQFGDPVAGTYAFGVYWDASTSGNTEVEFHVQLYATYA